MTTNRFHDSLQKKLLLFTLVPLLVVTVITSSAAINNKIKAEEQLIKDRVQTYAFLLESGELSFETVSNVDQLESLLQERVLHAGLINKNGETLYKTIDYDLDHQDNEESLAQSQRGYIVYHNEIKNKEETLSIHYPLIVNERIIGALHLQLSREEAQLRVRNYALFIVLLNVLGVVFIFVAITMLTQRIVIKRIEELKEGAEEITKGNLKHRIPNDSSDELGVLAETFNRMTTMLQKSQKELRNYNEKLKRTVDERTLKLKKANVKLKELDKQKDAFISVSAHELKTPLTSIKGFTQILQNDAIIKDKKKRTHYVSLIGKNAERLFELVLDIVDSSRLALGKLQINKESITVKEIMDEIRESMTLIIKQEGLTAKFTMEKGLPKILADRSRLLQVLRNLLINAVHFTHQGTIGLHISKKGRFVQFDVHDTGEGIPKDKQKGLFSRFYQVDTSMRRKVQGSGLGLSISRGLVEQMGGKIWFTSAEGKGTTFSFTLPQAANRKK